MFQIPSSAPTNLKNTRLVPPDGLIPIDEYEYEYEYEHEHEHEHEHEYIFTPGPVSWTETAFRAADLHLHLYFSLYSDLYPSVWMDVFVWSVRSTEYAFYGL